MLSFLRAKQPEPSHIALTCDGQRVEVLVKRSARAKRLTLRLRSTSRDAVVTAPKRTPFTQIHDFVVRHNGWLSTRLSKLARASGFEAGATVPLRGECLVITPRPDLRGVARVEGGALLIPGDPAFVARKVEDFLKKQAKADLHEATNRYAVRLGVSILRITLRDTQSRWGSCSSSGAMNYSWRLIMAPPFVLDYLCAHEVAHRREMNHSHRFWTIVYDLCPHTDAAKFWLKKHGAALHAYGAQ